VKFTRRLIGKSDKSLKELQCQQRSMQNFPKLGITTR